MKYRRRLPRKRRKLRKDNGFSALYCGCRRCEVPPAAWKARRDGKRERELVRAASSEES